MALVVEDGTGTNAAATSYGSVADAKTFATARGKTLAANDAAVEAFIVNGMDWLASKEREYKGVRLLDDQPLPFPRKCVYLYDACTEWPAPGALPQPLINALYQLVIEQDGGVDIMPTQNGPVVVREKIDVIETEYSEKTSMLQPALSRVEAFLAPVLNVGISALRSVRV